MAVLCGMPTIQYWARSAWLSVPLSKWACSKITYVWSKQFDIRRIAAVIRQVTATCPPTRAHWRHLANMIELVHPSSHSSTQPKHQIDRFSRVCTDDCGVSLYFTMVCLFTTQNCTFPCWPLDVI